jgi:hypothetical protein
MKHIFPFIALLAICCLGSCGKKRPTEPAVYTITLDSPAVKDGKVVLKWKMPDGAVINTLRLERRVDTVYNYADVIMLKGTDTEYTDTFLLKPYVQYKLIAQIGQGGNVSQSITSNKQLFTRPDLEFLPFSPRLAVGDKSAHVIYLVGYNGEIGIYDVNARRITKQIESGAVVGQCVLATHNGRKELYVSRNDGWLFIYDASTLDFIDQLNVGGRVTGIVYHNGKLFMSTDISDLSIVSYDRTTKVKLYDTAYVYTGMNLKLLPGVNTEIIGIYGSSGLCKKLSFSNDGQLQSIKSGNSISSYISSNGFEVMPSGDKIITATYGTIINSNLEQVTVLPHGSVYLTSFDFDEANRLIYCGTSLQELHTYSIDNYQLVKRIPTKGYPIRVFYDNGAVISVSAETSSSSSSITFIERL